MSEDFAAIKVPGSPFWNMFKSFTTDQCLAMLVNVAGTAGLEALLSPGNPHRKAILSFAGPVIEKIGFFPAHVKEAVGVYRSTPKAQRKPFSHYLKRSLDDGSGNLAWDVFVHDPMYIGMMFAGQQMHPSTPAWLLSTASFVAAMFGVAGLKVAKQELQYWNYRRQLRKAGFGQESYYESRFRIGTDPRSALEKIADKFGLGSIHSAHYNDTYFETGLPEYSSRTPHVRLRQRDMPEENRKICTAQIVYTRAVEMDARKLDQFRYFPVRKDKHYFEIDAKPSGLEAVANDKARMVLLGALLKNPAQWAIEFDRSYARTDSLLACADRINGRAGVLELKAYSNVTLLKEAMRYVMLEFPVLQTTHGKLGLTLMSEK